jgi:hypothetical protein
MSWYNPGDIFGHAANAVADVGKGLVSGTEAALGNTSNEFKNAAGQVAGLGNADLMASGGGTGGGKSGGAKAAPAQSTLQTSSTPNNNANLTGTSSTPAAPANGLNANGGSSTFLQDQFLPVLGQLQSAYNGLFGNGQPGQGEYGQAAGAEAANVAANYGNQQQALSNSFGQSQAQLPWEYAGQGVGQSSYAQNAENFASNAYNTGVQGIQTGQTADQAHIQQAENAAQGQYSGYLGLYNNPVLQKALQNSDEYYQNSQYGALAGDLVSAQQMAGQQTPLPTAVAQLASNPSYQQKGSTQLQNQLNSVNQLPTSTAAQNQISAGIAGNPNNPQGTSLYSPYLQQVT